MFPQHNRHPANATVYDIDIKASMCVSVTQYPSWSLAAPAGLFSAAGGWSLAAGLWPRYETPHRESQPAHSPPLALGSMMHFPLTMD